MHVKMRHMMTTERPPPRRQLVLPMPNPGDWATLTDAEVILNLSRQQILRLAKARVLTPYTIGQADRGRVTLFWRAEVIELAAARARARRPAEG